LAQDDDGSDDVVIVTGSRLKDANIESTSPVSTIGSESFDIRGTVDTIDLLNTLPQITPGNNSQNAGFANGANGTSTINLRGLGETRTLVLVDGKRLPFGSPTTGGFASDVNLVPAPLVERVEIVTGGASAVYGSDAIAGVANFILRKDFEGFELDGQFGFNQSGNNSEFAQAALTALGETPVSGATTGNETWDVSGIMGANIDGGRGNVTAYFRYLRNNGLQQGERDFSQCALIEAPTSGQRTCLGSNQGPFPTTFFIPAQFELDAMGNPVEFGLFDSGGSPLLDGMGNQIMQRSLLPITDSTGVPLGASTALLVDLDGDGTAETPAFDAMGNAVSLPFASSALSLSGNGDGVFSLGFNNPFNFNPFNPIIRSIERFNAGFNANYDINDNISSYMTFGFTQSQSPQIIAPSAAFGTSISQVNCDNPLLSTELLAAICGVQDPMTGQFARDQDGDGLVATQIRRRFVEGGPRTDDRTLTNFRIVGGFTGTVFDDWEWDVFGQFANTKLERLQFNQVTLTQAARALDIVASPIDGSPVCRTTVDGPDPMNPTAGATDPACVPFISAFQTGAENPAGLQAYIDTPTLTQGSIQQTVFGGTIQNSLEKYGVQSPWSDNAASILFGVEYRRDQLRTQADATNQQGLLIGAGGAVNPTNGSTEVWELFMETAIPLVEGRQGIESLAINGAFRYSDYSSRDILNGVDGGDFTATTFAAGLTWTPVEDIRLRAQYQRAIRAPNIGELFLPQTGNLTGLTDPCSGTMPTATQAQCANTGVPTALFGLVPPDSGQLNFLQGGNPDLSPEVANTYTIGAIITPRQVPGLTVSVDYYNISLKDRITGILPSITLNTCLQTGDPLFCGLITRDPDGSLTNANRVAFNINALNRNIAANDVSGIDGRVQYSYDFDEWGQFAWDYNASYALENSTLPLPGFGQFDCVGFYNDNCQNPNFEYSHVFTTQYTTNFDLTVSAVWRFVSSVERIASIDANTGAVTPVDPTTSASAILESESYLDLAFFYDLTENVRLRAGVNNVFDNDPPVVPSFGPAPTGNQSANSYPGNYDLAGRFIFTGINIQF
jgi:outer membrane receptor protein involved in Fe transport